MELNTLEMDAVLLAASREEAIAAEELTQLHLALVGGGTGGDPAFC
jgi:hypothetical protein